MLKSLPIYMQEFLLFLEDYLKMVNMLAVGDRAPDFVLTDTELNPVHLEDFRGRNIILVFFVNAFTSTCTKEACAFRDLTDRLVDLKTEVIGISVNDPSTNKEFVEKNRLAFQLLSDYNHVAIKAYGVESPDFAGLKGYTAARRSIFVVDKKGVVRYVWIADNSEIEPDYSEIEKALREIESSD